MTSFDIDENFVRLYLTVTKLGLKYALVKFHTEFPKPSDKSQEATCLYQQLCNRPFRARLGRLFPDQENILYGSPLNGTNVADMDLALVLKILRARARGTLSNDLTMLEKLRNEFSHWGSQPLTETFYNQKLVDIKNNLMNLGATSLEVDSYQELVLSDVAVKQVFKDLQESARECYFNGINKLWNQPKSPRASQNYPEPAKISQSQLKPARVSQSQPKLPRVSQNYPLPNLSFAFV